MALKLKGGPGSFRSFEDTPSLTLNFEKFAEGQSFHGVKKLNPNNSVQDRSFLCEKINRELLNAAGVPTPRAGHAIVALYRRELGLHVLLEGVNRQFLKRHFQDPGGNVYDGHAGMDVGTRIPVNEGENIRDRTRLRNWRPTFSSQWPLANACGKLWPGSKPCLERTMPRPQSHFAGAQVPLRNELLRNPPRSNASCLELHNGRVDRPTPFQRPWNGIYRHFDRIYFNSPLVYLGAFLGELVLKRISGV